MHSLRFSWADDGANAEQVRQRLARTFTDQGLRLVNLDAALRVKRHLADVTAHCAEYAARDEFVTREMLYREFVTGELTHLATIHPDAGISSSTVHVFAGQVTGRPVPDRFEGIDAICRLSPAELDRWIAQGRITDAFTLAAVTVARARGLLTT